MVVMNDELALAARMSGRRINCRHWLIKSTDDHAREQRAHIEKIAHLWFNSCDLF